MSDFAPGDLVVCVNAEQCPCYVGTTRVRKGSVYRISAARVLKSLAGKDTACVRLDRDNPRIGAQLGWYAETRFRKINKSDEGFAAWMRSMRPVKQPAREHAHTPSGNPS